MNFTQHIKENWKLSFPIILGQLGQIGTNIADNMMIGNSGSDQIAAAALANGIFIFLFVIGIGFSMASTPIIASLKAENDNFGIVKVLKNSIFINTIIGLSICISVLFISDFLYLLKQPDNLIILAKPYLKIQAFSVIPVMIYLSFKQFFEGLENTKTAMKITLIANALNIFLNWVLIYGKFNTEALGLYGAGLATLIARITMVIMIVIVFIKSKNYAYFRKNLKNVKIERKILNKIRKLGLPIGLQFAFEVSAFAGAGIMSGWIGEKALAAHQVALNLASISWAIATGFGAAVTVRISKFVGEKKHTEIPKIYNAGYLISILWMFLTGLIFIIFSKQLASLYLTDNAIINIAASLLFVAFLFQISDGAQVIALSSLRGYQDVKTPTWLTLIAYWVFGIPIGYLLAFKYNYGVHGVWYGLFIGLTLSALFLHLRLLKIKNKIQ